MSESTGSHEPKSDLSSMRALYAGKSLYVSPIGVHGDIIDVKLGSIKTAKEVAGKLNAIFNGFRHQLAESCRVSGEYAHRVSERIREMQSRHDAMAKEVGKVMCHLQKNADSIVQNPAYYQMLFDRLAEAGFKVSEPQSELWEDGE